VTTSSGVRSATAAEETPTGREMSPARHEPFDSGPPPEGVPEASLALEATLASLERHYAPLLRSRVRRSTAWPMLERRYRPEDVLAIVKLKLKRHLERGDALPARDALRESLRTFCDRALSELFEDETARRANGGRGAAAPRRAERHEEAASEEDDPNEELLALARLLLDDRERLAWRHVDLGGYELEEVGDLVLDCSAAEVRELVATARARLESLS